MAFKTSIELPPIKYRSLQEEVGDLSGNVMSRRQALDILMQQQAAYVPHEDEEVMAYKDTLLQDFRNFFFRDMSNISADQHSHLCNMEQTLNAFCTAFTSKKTVITNVANTLDQELNVLREKKRQLAGLSPDPITLDISDIQAQINHIDNIVPGSMCLYEERGDTYLAWMRERTMAHVTGADETIREGLKTDHLFVDQPFFVVGAAQVRVNLSRWSNVIIEAVHKEDNIYQYSSETTVHPHVLSPAMPCFGDFQGPIYEAYTDQQWGDLVTLIDLFLRQADNSDPAGKKWINYFLHSRNKIRLKDTFFYDYTEDRRVRAAYDAEYKTVRWVPFSDAEVEQMVSANEAPIMRTTVPSYATSTTSWTTIRF